jgi:tetratricopeptide (TPR) repeat protein
MVALQVQVLSQSLEEVRDLFDEGEYFFARKEYSEAAYYYKLVLAHYPDNANFNFKIGECYMNMPGSETLAIPYFERAIKNIVEKKKYRHKDFNETHAPLHAYFYLGNVYRINNQLGEALRMYDIFMNSPFYYGNYNEYIVENEVRSCERAKIIQDNPIDITEQALDTTINTTASENNVVVSGNGQSMAFVRKLKFYDAILWCTKQHSGWSQPVNLNPLIGSDGDLYPACLSFDGSELYLIKRSDENCDIYVSFRHDSGWTKAERINAPVNSRANETSACLSSDGKYLYFSSSRYGGAGGSDLYFCSRDENGKWGKVNNMGKPVNTPFDEEWPCLTNDDKTLYFSSKGHYSMGGFDVFYSNKTDKKWSDPVNAGYPVNNTSDNVDFIPLDGGRTAYYSRIVASGSSDSDIFRAIIRSNLPLP